MKAKEITDKIIVSTIDATIDMLENNKVPSSEVSNQLKDYGTKMIEQYANKKVIDELKSIAKEIYIRKEIGGPIANRIKELTEKSPTH